jgi:hypothetical protein
VSEIKIVTRRSRIVHGPGNLTGLNGPDKYWRGLGSNILDSSISNLILIPLNDFYNMRERIKESTVDEFLLSIYSLAKRTPLKKEKKKETW